MKITLPRSLRASNDEERRELGVYPVENPLSAPTLPVEDFLDWHEASIEATLPAPFVLPHSNLVHPLLDLNITPPSTQEIEVDFSPLYIWPTATTGHIEVSPLPIRELPSSTELISYAYGLEPTQPVGLSPLPTLVDATTQTPAPLSMVDLTTQMIADGELPVDAQWMVDALNAPTPHLPQVYPTYLVPETIDFGVNTLEEVVTVAEILEVLSQFG